MRKIWLILGLLFCMMWESGCVAFHLGALAKQCFAPRVVPCLFPQISFWHVLAKDVPCGNVCESATSNHHALETYLGETLAWTALGGAVVLDVALLPLNTGIVLFSGTSYHPFTVERVDERSWRFTWHGENFSTWEVHPIRMMVLQGSVTIREYRRKELLWLNSDPYCYRQMLNTASFGVEKGWHRQWEIPAQSEQEILVLLSRPKIECSRPRFAVLDTNKQWIKADFYGDGFDVVLSEDFIGTVSFEETIIEWQGVCEISK